MANTVTLFAASAHGCGLVRRVSESMTVAPAPVGEIFRVIGTDSAASRPALCVWMDSRSTGGVFRIGIFVDGDRWDNGRWCIRQCRGIGIPWTRWGYRGVLGRFANFRLAKTSPFLLETRNWTLACLEHGLLSAPAFGTAVHRPALGR